MCGFVGSVSSQDGSTDISNISSMLHLIDHRGPDGSGIHIQDSTVLGHVRLSILDLSSLGSQPMLNKDTNSALVFNGEIYNYSSIRSTLSSQGVRFTTTSDTEVLLKSLDYYGLEKTLGLLNGMFAFAYHNPKSNSILLARDRVGIKPLYYAN